MFHSSRGSIRGWLGCFSIYHPSLTTAKNHAETSTWRLDGGDSREYFHDHPEKDTKGSAAWTSNSKLKVYYKECWVRHFSSAEKDVISNMPEDIATLAHPV
jgi:hypothetical protein